METSYKAIRDTLKTGDVVLFDGKGFVSWRIKRRSGGPWSHVGMVYKLGERLCLWESTTLSTIPDVETGIAKTGVQLVNLSMRIESYPGRVAIRRVLGPRKPQALTALGKLYDELKDRPYEESLLELFRAAYDGHWGLNTEDLSTAFCSELTGESFQALEWVYEDRASNEYTPVDFSEEGKGPDVVILRAPMSWGAQYTIKRAA